MPATGDSVSAIAGVAAIAPPTKAIAPGRRRHAGDRRLCRLIILAWVVFRSREYGTPDWLRQAASE